MCFQCYCHPSDVHAVYKYSLIVVTVTCEFVVRFHPCGCHQSTLEGDVVIVPSEAKN